MRVDQITLQDLGIIGTHSLYEKVNLCKTQEGSDYLYTIIKKPLDDLDMIQERQATIRFLMAHPLDDALLITNGTLVMIRKFFESNEYGTKLANDISLQLNSFVNKLVNKEHLNYTTFILEHIKDLVSTAHALTENISQEGTPKLLKQLIPSLEAFKHDDTLNNIKTYNTDKHVQNLKTTHHIRRYTKAIIHQTIEAIVQIDAYNSMAKAAVKNKWVLPEMLPKEAQQLQLANLKHPLLSNAIGYHIEFSADKNMLILTGANMSGKSTFLRSLGMAVYMAQLGMAIAAERATISICNSLISNMKVQDDIFHGESYFYAEVKRMKHTAQQITDQDYNLVLMDEIFKGTNIYDAYDCTLSIIEHLQYQPKNIIVISTHLYEIKERIQQQLNHLFYKYFETLPLSGYEFKFTYQLKDGVCQDRIGYSVLKQEGVLDILNKKQKPTL